MATKAPGMAAAWWRSVRPRRVVRSPSARSIPNKGALWQQRAALTTSSSSSSSSKTEKDPLVLASTSPEGVTTLTMNRPAKLNAWTRPMLETLFGHLDAARDDAATRVVVLTGAGKYYCAGVDLAGTLTPMAPATLREKLYSMNKAMFGAFLDFPKPLIAAVNGPAIGASVTSATLCDACLASEAATFSTPFARLGIPPEGCSSHMFPKLVGAETAARMLGPEGWAPTAREAAAAGLIAKAVAPDALLDEAHALAKQWIAEGRDARGPHGGVEPDTDALRAVNDRESRDLADAFLSTKFLQAQADYLRSKGKTAPALVFQSLVYSRPLWSLTL